MSELHSGRGAIFRQYAEELDTPFLEAWREFDESTQELNQYLGGLLAEDTSVAVAEAHLNTLRGAASRGFCNLSRLILDDSPTLEEATGEIGGLWCLDDNARNERMNTVLARPAGTNYFRLKQTQELSRNIIVQYEDKAGELASRYSTLMRGDIGLFVEGIIKARATAE